MKKLFVIISIVVIIILIAFGLYYFLVLSKPQTTEEGGGIGFFKNFLPFGQPTPATIPSGTTQNPNGGETPTENTNVAQKLRKLFSEPTAGFGITDTKEGSTVRHIETATGHIYETELFSPKQVRISNTTIPVVYNAFWFNKNDTVVTQYIQDDNETVDTYILSLASSTKVSSTTPITEYATTTPYSISATTLLPNVNDVSVLGQNVFYIQNSAKSSSGFIFNTKDKKTKQVWNSPIREQLSQFVSTTTVALTTKPMQYVDGYAYTINTTTGVVKKILGPVQGLTTLFKYDEKQVLLSEDTDATKLFVYTIKDNSFVTLGPSTYPEKCVWSKKNPNIIYCAVPKETLYGNTLTNWYLGLTTFTDSIWKYDVVANTSTMITDLSKEGGEDIDVIQPRLSDSEQYLVFMNKKDKSLWSLDLTK